MTFCAKQVDGLYNPCYNNKKIKSLDRGAVHKSTVWQGQASAVQEREDRPFEIMADRFEVIPKHLLKNPPKKSVKSGLYLRVASAEGEQMNKIKEILADYFGTNPVYVVDASGKRFAAPESLYVKNDNSLILRLYEILGKENVKFVE